MTNKQPAGEQTPRTKVQRAEPALGRDTPRVRVTSVAGVLAVVPHLLGFHPSQSMVVVGLDGPRGRVKLGFRYDLPDPPDPARARALAEHAAGVLRQRRVVAAIAIGYGPGTLVTPVAEALGAGLRRNAIRLRDLLRVEDGRYWSYVCRDPGCCPPEGTAFDAVAHPAASALAAAGLDARPDRAALARSVAPLSGPAAESMRQATERALRRAQEVMAAAPAETDVMRPLIAAGRAAVQAAIATYRGGGQITDHDELAWLCVTVSDLRVRDDAWARMDPEHRAAHRRLWTDLIRRATGPYVPAPASLLAFTAWQSGEGALANIAIERALAADPAYSMAHLLGQALDAGLPPSAARLPMTPEEVEASYAVTERARAGRSAAGPARRRSATRPARRRPSG